MGSDGKNKAMTERYLKEVTFARSNFHECLGKFAKSSSHEMFISTKISFVNRVPLETLKTDMAQSNAFKKWNNWKKGKIKTEKLNGIVVFHCDNLPK